MWYISLIDLRILKNPCIPGIKPTWPLFNIVLKVLATAIRAEKEVKGIKIGKEEERKALQKVSLQGTYLNKIEAMYDKLTANIILNGEKLKAFPLRSETRQDCSLWPVLFGIVSGILIMTIREQQQKIIQIGKKK